VYRQADEFDVLHFHIDYWPFSLFSRQRTPFLTTVHGRLDLPELQPVFDMFRDAPVVSISDSQRRPLQANFIKTVHHGLPLDLLVPRPAEPRYLAFLGRICPEKGPDRAIRIAQETGIPLKIAAKVDRVDQDYYHSVIAPMIDGQQPDFLSNALGLLLPIQWPEPFGLVMIEAMACGTPVIAFNRGSVPEVIDHGLTGFVVEDEAEAVAAVPRLASLSRTAIRQCFERRFSSRRMAEDYLSLYQRLAIKPRANLRVVT